MRYADKRNSPCVVIQGSNEHERGTVVVKDLVEGKKLSSMIGSNQEWRGSRNAQSEIHIGDLVSGVKDVIGRQRRRFYGSNSRPTTARAHRDSYAVATMLYTTSKNLLTI
jgi:hypothetical protein